MRAIYPGSFDPVTCGHVDIIERAARVFDTLVVAVAVNLDKTPLFSVTERVQMLKRACKHVENVEVDYFHGLLVNYVVGRDAKVIIKGLRAVSDFEFEFQMSHMNKRLDDSVETMFMTTSAENSFLSSSLVKEVAVFGASLEGLVPEDVAERLIAKLKPK
jgi:pantetheine-phosphate adenylyltransferase